MTRRHRLSLVEYGAPTDLVSQIAKAASLDRGKARLLVEAAGERAARTLRLNRSPLLVDQGGVRAIDIAGMIRLAPGLELEIAPKFLGLDSNDARWREDFFFLANVSRHGQLLARERLRSSGGAPRDLATLVGRSLVDMYWDNRRKPLRSYRKHMQHDFYIEGEVDPFDLSFPTPDGFAQEVVRYDRRNIYNASILAAAKELLPEVSDSEAAAGLVRIAEDLPAQDAPQPHRTRRLPARYRAWRPVVNLSNDVIKGLGVSFREGFAAAPGYIVGTWRTWEDLLVIAVRLAYGRNVVRAQNEHRLGSRFRFPEAQASNLNVYPDLTVFTVEGLPAFVIDAKYKANVEKGRLRVSEADAYEAFAFATATACNTVILAYPAFPSSKTSTLGDTALFERLEIRDVKIYGVQIEVRGISRRSGLKEFSAELRKGFESVVGKSA